MVDVITEAIVYTYYVNQVMHTIRDTPKNPAGLCALSVENDGGYLAYPGNSQVSNNEAAL